jgi:hypothetical protein
MTGGGHRGNHCLGGRASPQSISTAERHVQAGLAKRAGMDPGRDLSGRTTRRSEGVDLLDFEQGKTIRKDSFWKIVA